MISKIGQPLACNPHDQLRFPKNIRVQVPNQENGHQDKEELEYGLSGVDREPQRRILRKQDTIGS